MRSNIWVVVGSYSDGSGMDLFGSFNSKEDADWLAETLERAQSVYNIRVIDCPHTQQQEHPND